MDEDLGHFQQQQEEQMSNHFAELAAIDCSKYVEKKGELSYLSWAWAVDQLLRKDPGAEWHYYEADGLPFARFPDGTCMVYCHVKAFGKTRVAHLPVMDHRNKAIANPDAFQVNTAMQRCLVKAIALHGLGLYIYAGEDVPRGDNGDKPEQVLSAEDQKHLQALRNAAMEGMKALETQWKALPAKTRGVLMPELQGLKEAARQAA